MGSQAFHHYARTGVQTRIFSSSDHTFQTHRLASKTFSYELKRDGFYTVINLTDVHVTVRK